VQLSHHSPENQLLGSLLRELRLKAGLRQVEVAERLSTHQSYVSKYEQGEKSFKFVEVRILCARVLDMPFQKFVRLYEERLADMRRAERS